MISYGGMYMLPGMGADELQTQHQRIWWGREEQQFYGGFNLDATTVDAGNTPTNVLRGGLALGYLTASKQLVHWNPYATDGSQRLAGFLVGEGTDTKYFGTAVDRFVGDVLIAGNVYASRLLIPGETTYGISGKTYEFLLREQMFGRFNVDDDMGRLMNWKTLEKAFTSGDQTLTLTIADNRTHITNRGADATGTIVLPAPVPGLQFKVSMVADQNITLDGPATGEFFPTANTEVLDEDDKQQVLIEAIRTGASTYQYYVRGLVAPPAEA